MTDVLDRTGSGEIRFTKLEILGANGREQRTSVSSGDRFLLRLHYECLRDVPNPLFGVRIFSNLGTLVTELNTWSTGFELPVAPRPR